VNSGKVKRISRRRFLQGALISGASLVAARCGGGATPTSAPPEPAATEVPPTVAPTAVPPTEVPTAVPPTAAPSGPKMGGTLNFAAVGDYNSFNPWRVQGVNGAMYNQVYSRLLYKTEDAVEHADIAEEWEMAPDGLSFTVKMKEYVKWHDGQECTAQDFVNMFEYMQDEELAADANLSKFVSLAEPIKNVEAVDKYTLKFSFNNPTPYITDILDYWHAIRIDDRSDPGMLKTLPFGTGPFKIVEWAPKEYSRFVPHEDYHLEGEPYLDEFIWKRLDQNETLIPNLQSGAVDGIQVAGKQDMVFLEEDPNYWVHYRPMNGCQNILVNCRMPPLDKAEVRRALSHTLDREQIWKTAYFGLGYPICATFHMPSSLGYREDLVMAHDFNLDEAAKMLEEAGASNLELKMSISSYHPEDKIWTLIWQADLAKIGVTLTINEVEVAEWYEIEGDDNLKGNSVHGWGTGRVNRDPAIFLGTQWPYRPYDHPLGWSNEEMTQLIEKGAAELDVEERRKIYQRCNEILLEDSPTINVVAGVNASAYSNDVKGVFYDLHGFMYYKETWLDR
jgi:peptide/nickel transport system substrate-binding protein